MWQLPHLRLALVLMPHDWHTYRATAGVVRAGRGGPGGEVGEGAASWGVGRRGWCLCSSWRSFPSALLESGSWRGGENESDEGASAPCSSRCRILSSSFLARNLISWVKSTQPEGSDG